MSTIFRIELLPARHGDCILVEYGEAESPHRVMIDGGPIGAYPALDARLLDIPEGQRQLELLVITHIDADHIEGAIKLLNHAELGLHFDDIWFNGLPHLKNPVPPLPELPEDTRRSVLHGEFLLHRIGQRQCNGYFQNGAIFVPDKGPLPKRTLPGGLVITLLSPDLRGLDALQAKWNDALTNAGTTSGSPEIIDKLDRSRALRGDESLAPDRDIVQTVEAVKTVLDSAVANRSSIAFLAEYAGRSCAFLADAQMRTIEPAFDRLLRERNLARLPLDAIKVSHHGSSGNITPAFLRQVQCRNYLISTDGSVFPHPNDAAIETIVSTSPGARLWFNYRSERTDPWAGADRQAKYGHSAVFPVHEQGGLSIDLMDATGGP